MDNNCIYTLVEPDWNAWECSNCKDLWTLTDGTPEDNHMNYCPHCGYEIINNVIETLDDILKQMD